MELLRTKNCDHGSLHEAREALEKLGTEKTCMALSKKQTLVHQLPALFTIPLWTSCQQQPSIVVTSSHRNAPSRMWKSE